MVREFIIIAHRGASAYLGEHNLASKALAYCQGADFLEQDVVLTRDGVGVVLHDLYLDDVSDVGDHFGARKRADGHYYVIDFTYEELSALHFFERRVPGGGGSLYPDRFSSARGIFRVSCLRDEIELVLGLNRTLGRRVGLYTEIKDPQFHRREGYDIASIVVDILRDYGLDGRDDGMVLPFYVQCFDPETLFYVRHDLGFRGRLIQLLGDSAWGGDYAGVDYAGLKSARGMGLIAEICDGVGVYIPDLLRVSHVSGGLDSSGLSRLAHDAGLCVHGYTLRADALPVWGSALSSPATMDDLLGILYMECGIDGIFTDFPDIAFRWRSRLGG